VYTRMWWPYFFFCFLLFFITVRWKNQTWCYLPRNQEPTTELGVDHLSFFWGEFDLVKIKENSWFLYFYHLVLFVETIWWRSSFEYFVRRVGTFNWNISGKCCLKYLPKIFQVCVLSLEEINLTSNESCEGK
jgi:hypothetical protein